MKLIDKDAVVAEIKRIKKEECPTDSYEGRCKLLWFEQFLSFLDTFEVKEVDLDNELDFVKDAYYYFTSDERSSMKKVAKHFFELGLKTQKGE